MFLDRVRRRSAATNGVVLLPGSVAELTADDLPDRRTRSPTSTSSSRTRRSTSRRYAERQAAGHRGGEGVLAAPRDRRARRDEDAGSSRCSTSRSTWPRASAVRSGSTWSATTASRSSRSWSTSRASRSGRTPTRRSATGSGPSAALIEHLLHIDEGDWVNSLFLSCRFSAARIGQYNEFVYAFFKCLSEERLQYAEGWYDEQSARDAEDITLGDWIVQRRCPHLKADLTRFGIVDGDMLTCQLHGWKFDLPSGRCLTSVGHEIRAHRDGTEAPADRVPATAPAAESRARRPHLQRKSGYPPTDSHSFSVSARTWRRDCGRTRRRAA